MSFDARYDEYLRRLDRSLDEPREEARIWWNLAIEECCQYLLCVDDSRRVWELRRLKSDA